MSKDAQKYIQCRLKKGYMIRTAWIPENKAEIGKILKIKNENGWLVTNTFSTLDRVDVKIQERIHKTHRDATDI